VLMFITSALSAAAWPTLGWFIAKVYFTLLGLTKDTGDFTWYLTLLALYWLLVLFIGLLNGLEKLAYGVAGEHLTHNVRKELLKGIIYKQISWFDSEKKAPGVLTNVMAEDISALNGMTTETLSVVMQAFLSIGLSLAMAFWFEWRTACVALVCSPIIIGGAFGMARLSWGKKGGSNADSKSLSKESMDEYAKANALLSDSVINYKTVISFGSVNTDFLIGRFEDFLRAPSEKKISNSHKAGLLFGYA